MLVDGGKGQLGVAVAVLEELGLEDIPVAALAKRFEEVYRPGDPEPIRTANIRSGEECGAGQQALYGDALLSRLRDAFTDAWAAAGDGEGFTNRRATRAGASTTSSWPGSPRRRSPSWTPPCPTTWPSGPTSSSKRLRSGPNPRTMALVGPPALTVPLHLYRQNAVHRR